MNKNIQSLYQKAGKFAGEKHHNQQVKGSVANYMLHLSNVAMEILLAYQQESNFDLGIAVQTALLHDTIEDTNTTFEEVKDLFGEEVAKNVLALTKNNNIADKEQKMQDSLNRIKQCSKEAKLVKIADRITNLQKPPKEWSKQKISEYHKQAQLIYNELKGEHSFLDNRLLSKTEEYSHY
ncbi:MAG: bifunctional (p)ppGpp synthetase/guanosine-3',5'-bis(diphosphate) 3'-pyrophosphohydrolase [Flavobacteriaceae bacterium]|nr:bifunctional (p)ppGpp synthetase/guanosine-3',5'-bis(diphosphate) 3'-pyrophosphohydrolase [Flavobacteriaceae bacterium]